MSKSNNNPLSDVHEVASKYWGEKTELLDDVLRGITIINKEPKSIVGFLPEYQKFPSVFFKVFSKHGAYQNEVNGYRLANTISLVSGITIPNIIKLLPEHSALLFERIPMQDSLPEIRRIFYSNSKVNWKQVGKWLRAFHDTEPLGKDNLKFIENIQYSMVQHLNQIGHLFQPDQIEAIKDLMFNLKDDMDQHPIDWVNMHGDFNLDSIKISNKTTYIIDFERLTIAPREYEVINFLAALQYSLYFLYRKSFFQWFSNEFLEGYEIQVEPTPLNKIFYLKTIFDLIAHYQVRKSITKSYTEKLGCKFLINQMDKATCQFLDEPFHSWPPPYPKSNHIRN